MARLSCGRAILWMALASGLSSCSVLAWLTPAPTRAITLEVTVPPATAAWVVAEICRFEFWGADPDPISRDAPLVRVRPGEFLIRYARAEDGVFRVFRNGRISAPADDRLLGRCRFTPTGRLTGSSAAAFDAQVYIAVEPSAQGRAGAKVYIHLRGEPARTSLAERLSRSLSTAAVVASSGAAVQDRHYQFAAHLTATVLGSLPAPSNRTESHLAAQLHLHRAIAKNGLDELLPAHSAAMRAVAHAPRYRLADRLITELRDRLAMADLHTRRAASESSLARAQRRLDQGDLVGAANWACAAVAEHPDTVAPHRLLARVFGLQGRPHRAIAEELIVLDHQAVARQPVDTDTILRLATLYASTGNATTGMHLIARHSTRLWRTARKKTQPVVALLGTKLPGLSAWRILQSADPSSPEIAEITALVAGDQTGKACANAYELRTELRRRPPPLLLPLPRSDSGTAADFRGAPGVRPAAPPR